MAAYKGYTPAQGKAHSAYISKMARIEICTTISHRDEIRTNAAAHGESVNAFIKRAIQETMERDQEKGAGA